MQMLVLGGTRFVSYAVAAAALARGHDVVCAARGESGAVPAGARLIALDREAPEGFAALISGGPYDAVVDTATRPSWVRGAVTALGPLAGHWTYVSSCSVYADPAVSGQTAESATLDGAPVDADETDMSLYGELKVAAERAVTDAVGDRAFVVRPGLIVGPGDRSGRFPYWVSRLALRDDAADGADGADAAGAAGAADRDGAPVLGPGEPSDPVQVVDVRDLAEWIVTAAETGLVATLDAISAPSPIGPFLADVAAGVGGPEAADRLVWPGHEALVAAGVEPWMGPGSLPLWLPSPEYEGFMARDVSASLAAGLAIRPIADTARDTLAWLRATPDAVRTGLTRDEEAEVLSRAG